MFRAELHSFTACNGVFGGTCISKVFKNRLCLFVDNRKWSLLETAVVLTSGYGEVACYVGFQVWTQISVVVHCTFEDAFFVLSVNCFSIFLHLLSVSLTPGVHFVTFVKLHLPVMAVAVQFSMRLFQTVKTAGVPLIGAPAQVAPVLVAVPKASVIQV